MISNFLKAVFQKFDLVHSQLKTLSQISFEGYLGDIYFEGVYFRVKLRILESRDFKVLIPLESPCASAAHIW